MAPKKKRMKTQGHEDSNSSSTDEPVSSTSTSTSLAEASSGCTKIVAISDKELLSVFSLLPLCDLQCLELVSHRFRWIALKVYSDRRSLSLIQTPQYRAQLEDITRYWYFTDYSTRFPFGDDCYRVTRKINLSAVQWFGQRFPRVTQLALYCVDHLSLERFVHLVQLYPTLERLILYSTGAQQTEYNQPQFWTSLYRLRGSIRYLHLPFDFEQNLTAAQLSPLMTPILRSFYLKTDVRPRDMFPSNIQYNLKQYGVMLQSPQRLCQNFLLAKLDCSSPGPNRVDDTVLPRHGLYMILERVTPAMSLVATNMMLQNPDYSDRITHLDLAIPANIGVLSVLPALARFTRLSHIRLTERKPIQPPSMFFSQLSKQNYRTKLGQPNRTQLPSVRQLNICQFSITPSTGILLYLPIIFPQIDTICIEDCPMITNSTGKIRHNSFPIWLLNSVQRFAQLHQLYHNQRLVLRLDRSKDGDKTEKDRLVHVIVEEMLNKSRI